jgi:hypothetical protein
MHIVRHEDCISCGSGPQIFERRHPPLSSQSILGFPLNLTKQPSIANQNSSLTPSNGCPESHTLIPHCLNLPFHIPIHHQHITPQTPHNGPSDPMVQNRLPPNSKLELLPHPLTPSSPTHSPPPAANPTPYSLLSNPKTHLGFIPHQKTSQDSRTSMTR